MIFKKKFQKKNFKNFPPIRLRDFESLNFAPKPGSNESLLLAYSKTVFRIIIDTVVRELVKNACANVVTMFKRKPIKNYTIKMSFDEEKNLHTKRNFGRNLKISRFL